tara:strand:+ start:285 stop:746 length:462 start_codon:yes stop_codon:yes gene_type:complete
MPTINQLSAVDTLNAGDQIPVYVQNSGDARKAAMSVLQAYMQSNLSIPGTLTTQYASPVPSPDPSISTEFTVTVSAGNTWLLLTPTGPFAKGNIVLPSSPDDQAEVSVSSTQTVAVLAVSAAASVTGAPTALAANGFFTMRYDAVNISWYRVG